MITLRGITWDHARGYDPLAASVQPYAEQFGVRIAWEKRSLKDFGDLPIDQLAERYDVLIIDHPHVGLAAATGALLPLDECLPEATLATLAAQSAGASHASYTYAGHQWGLAIDAAMQASVYRPDLLAETPPATWDAVLDLARRLRAKGLYIAIPLAPTDCICCLSTLCANHGQPPGADGHFIDETAGAQMLDLLAELHGLCHPLSLSWNPIGMLDHMSSADDVVYCPLTFCYTNYSRSGYAPKLLQFIDIPGVRGSILGGTGYAVSARCPHPAEACAYGAWLCSAEIQRTLYVEHGGQPGNREAWLDDHANAITANFFRSTLATLESAFVRPRHDGYIEFQEEAGNRIHAMLRDRTSSLECIRGLNQLYQETRRA